MYPLLFQETCSIEIITIGGLLGATLPPISFPFVPHHQGFWVFMYTDHNHISVIFSHSYTFIPLSHRVWVLCIGLSLSFTHTYYVLFTIIFIPILPVSPTGLTGCFIGFWFMIFIMSPFLPHIYT
jgi:hypothetical protein